MDSSELKIGHIGLGRWGKNILRNLVDLEAPLLACDEDPSVLHQFRAEYPQVSFVDTHRQIIEDPEVTAVILSTPAVTHYSLARAALQAGKDVFVEKPLSLTVEQGRELVELAHNDDRVLMVGHVLQYHPAIIKLKKLIQEGVLGKIQYIQSNRLNLGQLRTEENILWSFAPHDISVMLLLLGENPISVFARGGDYLNRGIHDITLSYLEFSNGVKGHIFVSWLHPFKEQKLVVVGSRSMAVFDDTIEEKLTLYPHNIDWKDGKIPVAKKAACEAFTFSNCEPLRYELQHFIDCVKTRRRPQTDGVEGVQVLTVLEKLQESLSSGSGQTIVPA